LGKFLDLAVNADCVAQPRTCYLTSEQNAAKVFGIQDTKTRVFFIFYAAVLLATVKVLLVRLYACLPYIFCADS